MHLGIFGLVLCRLNCFPKLSVVRLPTGKHSYQEHGNRMLLVWFHGEELALKAPAKDLYQGLIYIGNTKAAGTFS